MANIAIFLADGFEEVEAIAPIDILRRGGMNVSTVSITDTKQVIGSHNIPVQADMLMSELDFAAQDMLVLPGGKAGTDHLNACEALKQQVAAFSEAGKYVAAICAAPTILGGMGILKGKAATCYGGLQGELTGAEYQTESVVVDGHIITSRGMGTAVDFGLELLKIFTDAATAEKMAEGIMLAK